MTPLLKPSIARRLFFAVAIACALVWVGIYLLGRSQVYRAGTGEFDRDMLHLARSVADAAEAATTSDELRIALSGMDRYLQVDSQLNAIPPEFLAFHVWRADGTLVARSGESPKNYQGAGDVEGFSQISIGGKLYQTYATTTGPYRIEITQSLRSRQQAFDDVMLSREGLLSPMLVGIPLLLIPIFVAIRSGLTPLRRLAAELAARLPDDLRPIDTPFVYTELAPVTEELNSTLSRLRLLLEREREFLADAAHELRTPLALITAQADTLTRAHDPLEREAAGQRLRGGLARASRLVNQLLALARLDADAEMSARTLDLSDTVRDVLAAHSKEAEQRGIDLSYCGPDNLIIQAPGDAIESLLANLVSNSIRHGREGGQIQIDLSMEPPGPICLLVRDDGPGIPEADHDRIFARFHRGSDTSAQGSGLGLAIVRSSARQLGASVEMIPGLGNRGLGVRVHWQAASDTQS